MLSMKKLLQIDIQIRNLSFNKFVQKANPRQCSHSWEWSKIGIIFIDKSNNINISSSKTWSKKNVLLQVFCIYWSSNSQVVKDRILEGVVKNIRLSFIIFTFCYNIIVDCWVHFDHWYKTESEIIVHLRRTCCNNMFCKKQTDSYQYIYLVWTKFCHSSNSINY